LRAFPKPGPASNGFIRWPSARIKSNRLFLDLHHLANAALGALADLERIGLR
jgi:hypothetical protein